MTYIDARDEVLDTSHARAIQHCLLESEKGHSPGHVISMLGQSWRTKSPTWEDAVFACSYHMRRVAEIVPVAIPALARICLRCHYKFESVFMDDKLCPSCVVSAEATVIKLHEKSK